MKNTQGCEVKSCFIIQKQADQANHFYDSTKEQSKKKMLIILEV